MSNPFNICNMDCLLKHKEKNGNYSVVYLAKDAISCEDADSWMKYLGGIEFYGGQTSFGEIPRLQRYCCNGGEYFGKRAGWKDDGNPRWIARPYDDNLYVIQDFVQSYFDSCIAAMNIPGVNRETMFDSCLNNCYRTKMDSIKPHRDSEVIFGNNPEVMIVSIGCPREIIFERIIYDKDNLNSIKKDKEFVEECGSDISDEGRHDYVKIMMPSRSILFMGGEVQKYYSHEIKKVFDAVPETEDGLRYSLTFRQYHH